MPKYLKKYNKETNKWELVSAPDVSVVKKMEDGSDITDTNVIVTNVNYTKESGETTNLGETLTVISDDISRLQRNVSWLAEHGTGGGSGGGGGSTTPFGIVIVSPVLVNESAYVSGKTFEVEFMITGGTDGEQCEYSYVYDSNPATDYALITVGTSVKIQIDNTGSTLKEHSMIIRAKNPYGTNITPKSFRIYESTLSLAFDVNRAGDDYKFGIYNIRKDSTYANIPLLLTNGLMRSDTVIVAKCLDNTYVTDSFINTTTDEQQMEISLWKLFPNKDITVGEYYVMTFQASATLGANTIISNEVQLRILIISPTQISIVLGVNGTSGEIVEAPLRSSLVYNFKVYTPALVPPVESTYYSAKIHNDTTGNDYLILGKYFDETLKEDGATYSSNDSALVGRTISSRVFLDGEKFHVNDKIYLTVKTWDMTGAADRIATASTEIHVEKESDEIFPRQSNNRNEYNTIFLSWNKENAISTSPTKWTSTNSNYGFLDGTLAETEGHTVIADINLMQGNAASGIKTDGQTSYMRLQNRAYAVADLARYANEVGMMTAEDNNLYGFTISFTVQVDNHNDTQHTILLWGTNNADRTLTNGIRIDSDKAQWVVNERKNGAIVSHNLSCHISSGNKLTIDFSYVRNTSTSATARIYVNGILNAATDLEIMSPQYIFPDKIYFGANKLNNTVERYSDINIYELSVYTRSLNDMQISINGKNAKFIDVDDYKNWKEKNFISANELDPRMPESVFFSNGKYITEFDTQQINNIAARSKIPTLYLNFPESSRFTSEYFYAKQTSSALTFDATATYYDPVSRRDATFKVRVSLQGTSTLGYRIKNLEMYVNETFVKDGETYVKLFQPKKEWLPESQFTLKADVVDSAHANNAILGEWINTSGVFKNNPAMDNYIDNRPQDWDDAYSAATTDAERRAHTYTDDPEVATIKHTLEGFPYLMFIKFSDKSSYTFLGIYSFNLGRYSYYNMGMKFLKGYSRRDGATKVACPKIINYYEEMPTLGNISASDVFSFEMGNAGNLKIADYPVWSQYDRTVVQSYGSFRYLGSPESEGTAWTNLCALFEAIARFRITSYNGDLYPAYDNIKYYTIDAAGHYQTTGEVIGQDNESNTQIVERLSIENAAAYFIVANAFGMTDSLGKNLTIRTWDGGRKWWFCFYDMDTALALANDGSEGNPVTIAIDKITMRTDPTTSASILETTYHDNDSKYAAVLSKIWGIFRDDRFLYLQQNQGRPLEQRYEYIWNSLRSSTGKLSTSENFTNIMAERVDACGEMIYNYDYNTKYIQDTAAQEGGAAAAITFLHGTRVEYVRDWLRKHFYFLDGMFDANRLGEGISFSYTDSPYNWDIVTFVANYSSAIRVIPFTVQVSTPSFIGINVGSDPYKKYYIDTENVDTTIYFANGTSSNSQLNIRGSSTISKLFGLQGGFQAIQSNNETGVIKTLSTFDVSTSTSLNDDPFHNNIFGVAGESSLEAIDLSNTHGIATLSKYEVDLSICQKLIDVNISNSDVTALVLPDTSLQRLNVTNSNIVNFTLANQSVLTSINLDGCNKLSTINIDNCNAITNLTITDKINLSSISISNCNALSSITISRNYALTSINLSNNQNLKSIIIEDCDNPTLSITIISPSLENIVLSNLSEMTNSIIFPSKEALSSVTALTISNCYKIRGIRYMGSEEEIYNEKPVFDLSPFTNVSGNNLNIRNANNIEYVRVANDDGVSPVVPLKLNRNTFYGCSNLTRIFGYIEISEAFVFNGFQKFFLNHEGYTPGDGTTTPPFVYYSVNPYYTNVKITATQLDYCFANTSCDISDAYYVLQLCNEDVLSLKALFSNCPNIRTSKESPLNENTFSKCVNVENIDSIFNGACYIGGEINERLLTPLIDNLTTFNDVFAGNYTVKTTECFFPVGCKIKSIVLFNPQASDGSYHRDNKMLINLTEVEEIVNSFNDCNIDFTMGERWDATELFKYNTKLLKIESSFRDITGYGSLGNIFGGESNDLNFYPRSLSSVTESFTIKGGDHEGCTLYEGDTGAGVLLPIGNSFLKSIAGSIVYVTGNKPGNNVTYGAFDGNSNRPSFCGRGILKYLDNFDYALPKGSTHHDDCNGEDFPYDIFENCTNLKEFPKNSLHYLKKSIISKIRMERYKIF